MIAIKQSRRVSSLEIKRFVDVDGLGARELVGFRRDVHWVRSGETSIIIRNSKLQELKRDGGTQCDVGGFLNCLAPQFHRIEHVIEDYDISADGGLEVAITLKIVDDPLIPCRDSSGPRPGILYYNYCPNDWLHGTDEEIESWRKDNFGHPFPGLRRLTLYEGAIWTSKLLSLPHQQQFETVEAVMRANTDHLDELELAIFEVSVGKVRDAIFALPGPRPAP